MYICRAEERHIPGMICLLKQVGQVHHVGRPDIFRAGAQKYNEEDLKALLQDQSRPIFIAEEDGAVLGYGFCILKQTKNDPVLRDSRSLYIDDLCVDENCRGKHVGSQIYAYIKDYARTIGCHTITLNVWAFNESALRFYEAMGMQMRNIHMEDKLEEN